MSTVKIKTEPTTTATAVVDVKVKLEPSLSTADIKLEQHTSDIDTKSEPDSEDDSEEDYIKSESDDDDEDTDQDQATATSNKQRQFICKHHGCGRGFNSSGHLSIHQHEHRLQTELNILGITYILARRTLDDRWPCPVPGCKLTTKTANALRAHTRRNHSKTVKQQQEQQPPSQIIKSKHYFLDVDNFYVNSTRCGYHNTTGLFICHECKLVPECLLSHLQQKHGYDEKSIDSSTLPESAVTASTDPNINQHTSNPHLAAAISRPYQQHHRDILQGWLCVTSNCGHCGYTVDIKNAHKRKIHQSDQIETIPALVLRLLYSKIQSSCFLITRIDQASGAVTTGINVNNRRKLDNNHNGLNAQDENEDDISQNETTKGSNQRRQWRCKHPNCGLLLNSAGQLSIHRREHTKDTVITVQGMAFTLTRQSLDERWSCPASNCDKTCKSINVTREHILKAHSTVTKQKRVSSEDDDDQQQPIIKRRQYTVQYLKVEDFYINGTKYGYHSTTGVFMCYKCRLIPECLLSHLQQKHGYDEKSIDNSVLPDSAVNASADPNGNQHTNNSLLAAAIREPNQLHPDIVQGWLCVISNCGYCCSTQKSKYDHHYKEHKGEQLSTVPALVLRLIYARVRTFCLLITRLDTITSNSKPDNLASHYNSECDDEEDDGDELVLSDYSDENDTC